MCACSILKVWFICAVRLWHASSSGKDQTYRKYECSAQRLLHRIFPFFHTIQSGYNMMCLYHIAQRASGLCIFFYVPSTCSHCCCVLSCSFHVSLLLAIAVQNVDLASAQFAERIVVSMSGLVNEQKCCILNKTAEGLFFSFYFCWSHQSLVTPTSWHFSHLTLYTCAKKTHTSSLENLDWELDRM